jgi:hypothetical protein
MNLRQVETSRGGIFLPLLIGIGVGILIGFIIWRVIVGPPEVPCVPDSQIGDYYCETLGIWVEDPKFCPEDDGSIDGMDIIENPQGDVLVKVRGDEVEGSLILGPGYQSRHFMAQFYLSNGDTVQVDPKNWLSVRIGHAVRARWASDDPGGFRGRIKAGSQHQNTSAIFMLMGRPKEQWLTYDIVVYDTPEIDIVYQMPGGGPGQH